MGQPEEIGSTTVTKIDLLTAQGWSSRQVLAELIQVLVGHPKAGGLKIMVMDDTTRGSRIRRHPDGKRLECEQS
jgi:hypothetical protein